MRKTPTAPPDGRGTYPKGHTSPKYDDNYFVFGFSLHLVGFGGGGRRRAWWRLKGVSSRCEGGTWRLSPASGEMKKQIAY